MKKLSFLLVLIIGLSALSTFAGNKPGKEVQKAFELRMKGKVDEAKTMLESILTKDSTNAMAHYEMARLKHYMLVGGGAITIDDILTSINKAVKYDPKNVTYAYYQAIANFLNAFMAMETGQDVVKDRIAETCTRFENVLVLKQNIKYSTARTYSLLNNILTHEYAGSMTSLFILWRTGGRERHNS